MHNSFSEEQAKERLAELIREISPSDAGDGEKAYHIRCAPGILRARIGIRSVKSVRAEGDEGSDEGDGQESDAPLVTGIASSNSVDFYGTDMSPEALSMMKDQFDAGVSFLPRHGGWMDHVEWDEEFGLTSRAEVFEGQVVDAPDGEKGLLLRVWARLDPEMEKAKQLVSKLEQAERGVGRAPGLSIGGWFTELVYYENEDGELTRIKVMGVVLDHVAVVRSPANPDSTGLALVRSVMQGLRELPEPEVRAADEESVPGPAEAPEESSVEEGGDNPELVTVDMGAERSDSASEPVPAVRGLAESPKETDMSNTENESVDVQALIRRIEELEAARAAAPAPATETPAPTPEPVKADEGRDADFAAALAKLTEVVERAITPGERASGAPARTAAPAAPKEPTVDSTEVRMIWDAMCNPGARSLHATTKDFGPIVRDFVEPGMKVLRSVGIDPDKSQFARALREHKTALNVRYEDEDYAKVRSRYVGFSGRAAIAELVNGALRDGIDIGFDPNL